MSYNNKRKSDNLTKLAKYVNKTEKILKKIKVEHLNEINEENSSDDNNETKIKLFNQITSNTDMARLIFTLQQEANIYYRYLSKQDWDYSGVAIGRIIIDLGLTKNDNDNDNVPLSRSRLGSKIYMGKISLPSGEILLTAPELITQ